MLRLKKKERDGLLRIEYQLEKDKQILKNVAEKDGMTIIDRAALGRKEKISTILLEMIKPLFYEAHDEQDVKGIVSMGVVAWNCGIIKETEGEAKLKKVMKSFKSQKNDDNRRLLDKYIQIKCSNYGQYNDFITHFEMSFEKDGQLNFTVLTGVTNDLLQTLNN